MDELPKQRRGPIGWLTARTWRFWAIAAILLTVLHVASVGPWFWLDTSGRLPRSLLWANHFYDPLRWIITRSPDFVMDAFNSYLSLWLPAEPMEYHGP